ncbi:MAG TPA: DUF6445 family protein [Steroidobacteraceae bacterium]
MPDFDVNPDVQVDVRRVGRDRLPVIVIDSFSMDPESLVARAIGAAFIDAGSTYPGIRAPAPQGYVETLLGASASLIEEHFGAAAPEALDMCAYSMVTTPPAHLRAIQRIPHFDGPDENRIAFLHYLCAPHQGGTSFYRHCATDLEQVTRNRAEAYRATVVAELRTESAAQEYVVDDTRFFERIETVEAAFNRLIIYRGNALHSGDISGRTVLTDDPRRGRLTINGFGFLAN